MVRSFIACVFFLGIVSAHADQLVLDPHQVDCRVEMHTAYSYWACNIYYNGQVVHRGRWAADFVANGDRVRCLATVTSALEQKKNLVLLRDHFPSWDHLEFFKVQGSQVCPY